MRKQPDIILKPLVFTMWILTWFCGNSYQSCGLVTQENMYNFFHVYCKNVQTSCWGKVQILQKLIKIYKNRKLTNISGLYTVLFLKPLNWRKPHHTLLMQIQCLTDLDWRCRTPTAPCNCLISHGVPIGSIFRSVHFWNPKISVLFLKKRKAHRYLLII